MEVRIDFSPCSEDITDVAAALLADAGYESFVPDDNGLTAYIRKDVYTPDVETTLSQLPFPTVPVVTVEEVEGRDWNHEWEKNYFKPIVVDGEVVIHSSFHTDVPVCRHDIVIDPKMAFGTGHHATTCLMIRRILASDLEGKDVIDMGTGTGILAILCALRGAGRVTGIEIDTPAWINAGENIRLNSVENVTLLNGDASALEDVDYSADLFLANINRNVITADIEAYARHLKAGGLMALSGFYMPDVKIIEEAAAPCGLEPVDVIEQDGWVSLLLKKC